MRLSRNPGILSVKGDRPEGFGEIGTVTGLSESYNTADAGTGKTLSVASYVINDGNSGGNYAVVTAANKVANK